MDFPRKSMPPNFHDMQLEERSLLSTMVEAIAQRAMITKVDGTYIADVSYNRITQMPEPQFWFQTWTYMYNR